MVAAFERDEPRAWDHGGHSSAFLEGRDRVVPAVQDRGRHGNLGQMFDDVGIVVDRSDAGGVLGRSREPLEFVEPGHLLRRAVRNEARGEELAKRRVLLTPTLPYEGLLGLRLLYQGR